MVLHLPTPAISMGTPVLCICIKVYKRRLSIHRKSKQRVSECKVYLVHQHLAKIFRLARQCMAVMTSWPVSFGVRSIKWSSAHPNFGVRSIQWSSPHSKAWVPNLILLTLISIRTAFLQSFVKQNQPTRSFLGHGSSELSLKLRWLGKNGKAWSPAKPFSAKICLLSLILS